MYKLVVVSGPNRGSSFAIHKGENWIGRRIGNEIVLSSTKVSKRHCALIVSKRGVRVDDPGSANGTFVNGKLVRSKPLSIGDRVSVGEFVFELTQQDDAYAGEAPGAGMVLDFPGGGPGMPGAGGQAAQFPAIYTGPGGAAPQLYAPNPYAGPQAVGNPLPGTHPTAAASDPNAARRPVPQDLKGKLAHYFDHRIMPVFYGLLLKHEWHVVAAVIMAVFLVLNLMISVQPAMDAGRSAVIREVARRATFFARSIADRNAPYLAQRLETRTEIGAVEDAPGVQLAVLIDLDNRIIAPASRQNQYLNYGGAAIYAKKLRRLYDRGDEQERWFETDDSTITAFVPVKVLNSQKARNEVVALAVVSIDTSQAVASMGDVGVAYGETLIYTGLLAGLVLLILHRLTLKPFQVLSDDIDKALKGELPQVTREFKFQEVEGLWDLINSALQRLPKGGEGLGGGLGFDSMAQQGLNLEELSAPFRAMAEAGKLGVVVCDADRRVVFISEIFEEISGIRADGAIGQELPSVARDQALGALVNDLFDRAVPGQEPVAEDFDFSGIGYNVQAVALANGAGALKGYVLSAARLST